MDALRTQPGTDLTHPPDPARGCTLPGDRLAERLAWIRDEILPHARRTERLASGVAWELDAAPGVLEKIDRLIALERECCGHLAFERTGASTPGRVRLEVRGVDAEAVLAALGQGRTLGAGGPGGGACGSGACGPAC